VQEVLADVSIERGDSRHHDDYKDEDLHLDDDYDDQYAQPAASPPKKKKASKKKKSTQDSHTELTSITSPDEPSSTAFILPPPSSSSSYPPTSSSSSSSSAASSSVPGAKKYLNNVTSYFNEKREQFNRNREAGSLSSADPEMSGTIDDLSLREAALKRREAEILAKEQKVDERERQVKQYEGHMNNWPFKRWAILYHNIAEDILPENQSFIRNFYFLWMFELFCLGWQFLAIVVDDFSGSCSGASIITIIENALFCCAGLFGSWLGWYKVIYDASKKSNISSIKYGRFTCGFSIHLGWVMVMLTGVWASDGVISLLQTVTGSCSASSVFFGIGTAAWGINLLWSSYVSKLAYSKYKAAGGTLASMRNDFTKEAAKAALSRA
jgi:secretory carrier-associated membrane protein